MLPRIAVLGLSHEANTFSSHTVGTSVFEATGVLRGEEIRARHAGGATTVSGFLAAGEEHGAEMVPLVMTTLVPSGVITADALRIRTDELVDALAEHGPFDGILASLHGAAVSENILDVDGYLLRRFRETVGPGVPIGVSLDLHANISAQMCEYSDVLNTYRTNPHVDAAEVAAEVAELIIRTVRGEIRPTQWFVPIPAAINILRQNTAEPPMSDLIADVRKVMARRGVLSATVAEGYPYADVPEMGMAAVVVTDDDPHAARLHANGLALQVWEERHLFDATALSPDEAIEAASTAAETPVLLLDVGDNIGGGAPGDSVTLLNAARTAQFSDLLIIVVDPEAAATCTAAGVGGSVHVSIGAKSDPQTGPPVQDRATVLALHHGAFEATEAVHAGMSQFQAGPSAAVRLDSGQTVILITEAILPLSTAQLSTLGLAPSEFAAIVAKGVHSPLAGYAPHVASVLRVNTPGITSADLHGFTYRHRRKPMLPFEPDAELRTSSADGNTANFSPAVLAGGLLFVSGQASVDDGGFIVAGTFAEEVDRSIDNVRRILAAYGLDLADVVKVGAYVQNPAHLSEFNTLYRQYFTPPLPARTTITNCLTDRIKFEIDVVAAVRPSFPADR